MAAANSVGGRIRALRKEQGLTQTQLAELAGISSATVSAAEQGKATPYNGTLDKLAEALQVTAENLTQPEKKPRKQREKAEKTQADAPAAAQAPQFVYHAYSDGIYTASTDGFTLKSILPIDQLLSLLDGLTTGLRAEQKRLR